MLFNVLNISFKNSLFRCKFNIYPHISNLVLYMEQWLLLKKQNYTPFFYLKGSIIEVYQIIFDADIEYLKSNLFFFRI